MDELVNLGEEFCLADAAAAALDVETRAEPLPLAVVAPNPSTDRLDLSDRSEIHASPPDEGVNRVQKIMAEIFVARRLARADEGGALPRQGRGFVIADCRIDRQCDRGDLRRRTKPEIDPEGIAFLGSLLDQLHYPLGDPN